MRNPDFYWGEREEGLVTVTVVRTGFYDRVAQRFFHAPPASRIDLDRYGSFVWEQIDGTRTIHEISLLVRERFGEEAEPLVPRLVKFFAILKDNRFVAWRRG